MERSIARLITFLARKSQICLIEELEQFNLTVAEQPFFMALYHWEGVSQEKLTSLVGVDKAATTRAVKSLEKKGMLIRRQDENDKRQNKLYLTENAKGLWPKVRDTLQAFNAQITAELDDKTVELVYYALEKMELTLNDLLKKKDNN